jgi:hypothetical protein
MRIFGIDPEMVKALDESSSRSGSD